MKIKKTLFSTELEFDIDELSRLYAVPTPTFNGLVIWIKQMFGLNLVYKSSHSQRETE